MTFWTFSMTIIFFIEIGHEVFQKGDDIGNFLHGQVRWLSFRPLPCFEIGCLHCGVPGGVPRDGYGNDESVYTRIKRLAENRLESKTMGERD
jgi:hypothetical protein